MTDDEQMTHIMTSLFTIVRAVNTGAPTLGLDKSAIIAIYAIRQLDPARPTAVAGACGLDQSTVSRHLKSLEDKGLVRRSPDPDDRRAQQFSLTSEGAALLADMDALRLQRLEEALAGWSPEERERLHDVIGRLADSLVVADARRRAAFGQ